MTIHYHGTPINPQAVMLTLPGKHFCVSFYDRRQCAHAHRIGQSVMLDNGAYVMWRRNPQLTTYVWDAFYDWAQEWLVYHTTWAVIPDCIGGSEDENDFLIARTLALLGQKRQLAPVWHMHESLDRLKKLTTLWDRVCIGSSGDYSIIGSPAWNNRMNEAFNLICAGSGRPPAWIHMLRGMSLAGSVYPFASVDSTDVAQNHHRPQNTAEQMVERWDGLQCPALWTPREIQQRFEIAESEEVKTES